MEGNRRKELRKGRKGRRRRREGGATEGEGRKDRGK
jgi:hypothetical protein